MAGEKAQGAILSVSSAELAAKTLISATAANPVTVGSTAHALTAGTIVRIASVLGMTQINDRAFQITNPVANAFDLKGVNGTAYSAYTSAGQAFPQTMIDVGYTDNIGDGFNGQAAEIDTSHLRSLARENIQGLPDFGELPFSYLDIAGDTGQVRLQALHESGAIVAWSITLPSGRKATFMGWVKQLGFPALAPDTVVKGSGIIRVSNFPVRFS